MGHLGAESGLPWVLLPSFLAELGLPLWLTMQNLNVPKWKENRGEGAASPIAHFCVPLLRTPYAAS